MLLFLVWKMVRVPDKWWESVNQTGNYSSSSVYWPGKHGHTEQREPSWAVRLWRWWKDHRFKSRHNESDAARSFGTPRRLPKELPTKSACLMSPCDLAVDSFDGSSQVHWAKVKLSKTASCEYNTIKHRSPKTILLHLTSTSLGIITALVHEGESSSRWQSKDFATYAPHTWYRKKRLLRTSFDIDLKRSNRHSSLKLYDPIQLIFNANTFRTFT